MARSILITKSQDGIQWSRPLDYVLATLREGQYDITVTRHQQRRTLPQNALMWMWFACISRETGQPLQDVHDAYCYRFLPRPVKAPNGDTIIVPGHTSKLNRQEMTEFMDKVQADAAAEMCITLPTPEDLYYNDFVNEYKGTISWLR